MFQKQNKAFTLVELIVVITILSIMGTIAFISLGGYAGLARESARIADINTISKALSLYYVENNFYPDTASGTTVTYSGSTLWTQGYFTDTVRTELKKLSQVPTDPLIGSPYIYSVTYNKQEFQLAGGGERGGALSATSLIPETHALFSKAIVKGNYNGAILGKQIDNSLYIFGVPSIVTTQTGSMVTLDSIFQNRSFVLDKFGAIPPALRTAGQTSTPLNFPLSNITVTPNTAIVYSGSVQGLTTSTGVLNLTQNIYNLYSGSPLTQVEEIQTFTETNPSTATTTSTLVSQSAEYLLNTPTVASLFENTQLQALVGNTQATSTGSNILVTNPLTYCATSGQIFYIDSNGQQIAQVSNTGFTLSGNPTNLLCNGYIAVCSGSFTGYIIQSCNLGSNTVGTGTSSYGNYYQWGNNYGSIAGGPTISLRPDTTGYGPGNYYTSTGFILYSMAPPYDFDWSIVSNPNLWGNVTNTNIARQGPCTSGYYVPKSSDWDQVISLGGWQLLLSDRGNSLSASLKLPYSGCRHYFGGMCNQGTIGQYWSSTPGSRALHLDFTNSLIYSSYGSNGRGLGLPVRCFKN